MSEHEPNRLIHRGRDFDVRELHPHAEVFVEVHYGSSEEPTRKRETRIEHIRTGPGGAGLELAFAVVRDGGGEDGRAPVLYLVPPRGPILDEVARVARRANEQAAIAFDALDKAHAFEVERDIGNAIVFAILRGDARTRKRARRLARKLGVA